MQKQACKVLSPLVVLSRAVTGEKGVAIGNEAVTKALSAIAIGNKVSATKDTAISIG